MSKFDDALRLVEHCEAQFPTLKEHHDKCLHEQVVSPSFQIEVKNLMENLRSALDYCARGLYEKFVVSKKARVRVYFPYANPNQSKAEFRKKVLESFPGLDVSRPDIVDKIESYQYFGNTGNWLYLLMKIVNEHKHEQLTPQIRKEYKFVRITATIPAGGTHTIDLKNIPLGKNSDGTYEAVAGVWECLEFTGTEVVVLTLLSGALIHVRRAVDEFSMI